MRQQCQEYLTHLWEGWPVTGAGGWLAGDGDDGMTAGGGWQQCLAWGGQLTGDSDGGRMTAMASGVDGGSIGNIWHIAGEKGHSAGAGGETVMGDMTVKMDR